LRRGLLARSGEGVMNLFRWAAQSWNGLKLQRP
jgi:hypothetical protein